MTREAFIARLRQGLAGLPEKARAAEKSLKAN